MCHRDRKLETISWFAHAHARKHTHRESTFNKFSILCFSVRPLRSSFHAASPSSHLVLERRARPGKLICRRGSATSPPRLSFLSLHTFPFRPSPSDSRACPTAGRNRRNSDGWLAVCCRGRRSAAPRWPLVTGMAEEKEMKVAVKTCSCFWLQVVCVNLNRPAQDMNHGGLRHKLLMSRRTTLGKLAAVTGFQQATQLNLKLQRHNLYLVSIFTFILQPRIKRSTKWSESSS